jgi:hypothetical protein
LILSLRGDSPALIPADVCPPQPKPGPRRPDKAPRPQPGTGAGGLDGRINAYLARLPRLSAGQGRHCVGYTLACWLARDLNLGDRVALGWLRRWDEGNSPPLGAAVLGELLACAHAYGHKSYGSGLGCEDAARLGRRHHKTKTFRFTVEV